MKYALTLIALVVVTAGAIAQGSSNTEIATFAKNICDEIRLDGRISRSEIELKIDGKAGGVARMLGLSVGADGKIVRGTEEYTGLPFNDVAEQMSDSRECRLVLAKILIDERNRLAQAPTATGLAYGEFAQALSGGRSNKACGHGRDTRRQSCVRPLQPGGRLVPGTVAAVGLEQNGTITGWRVTTDHEQLACIELQASTRACEILVSIKARAAAVEVFPKK